MKLQILRALIGLLIVSIITYPSFSKDNRKAQTSNMSGIVEKINELKTMEKIINDKITLLEKEKKELETEKKNTDIYVKQQKETIDKYVEQKQQELNSLKKQIASEKIKKLSSIYSNAKAQAAADELSRMNEDLAAQILIFMQPRKAGAIISKMNPEKASQIFQKYISKKSNKQ